MLQCYNIQSIILGLIQNANEHGWTIRMLRRTLNTPNRHFRNCTLCDEEFEDIETATNHFDGYRHRIFLLCSAVSIMLYCYNVTIFKIVFSVGTLQHHANARSIAGSS